jgi:hypothetical protein
MQAMNIMQTSTLKPTQQWVRKVEKKTGAVSTSSVRPKVFTLMAAVQIRPTADGHSHIN